LILTILYFLDSYYVIFPWFLLSTEQQKPNVYTSKALPIQKKSGFLGKAQESFLNKKKLPGDNINTGTANNNENSNNLVHEPAKEKVNLLF
jgi:hypothetical protein